ncbi:hypothetical protein [Croceimicrobium hydrocarbonivorans]|uniref:DUF3857 domain-containing protein n=1 Tax=Croceimicrobium hydrocarbonivorans TaxID=2761580 RepID=A0A7H0VBC6_9FLAO|nr:hypothetical protein [Croceimicrobium hydrocarbonivorans]QNR23024.1 hypothetical protein H4K34_11605 [Croceimicrobium hydrocarbonivorans]
MARYLIVLLLCLGWAGNPLLAQGRPYTAEYWEKNWRDWPRPRFDYRIDSFAAVQNIVQREYFNSGSDVSGERYFHYARFQYPDQSSIDNWSKILFQLPNYEILKDIDFRIWEEDILVYEARAASIRNYFLDSLIADPHSGKLFAFSLQFPELKPGQIVEVMISLEGAPLPYNLGFNEVFPISESIQRIKVLSAYPLQFSASEVVEQSKERIYENIFYSFKSSNCKALNLERGLTTVPAELPSVWLDWKDQIFIYDREENGSWSQIIDHMFYKGDVQDYAVYQNTLDQEFGLQQYYGSWVRPVRYFHERSESLSNNEAYAAGRWRLSRAYAERWLAIEDQLRSIIEENSIPNWREAMDVIYRAQETTAKAYIRNMPVYPPVFTEYGLFCSHYEALFSHFDIEHRLVFFYPERSGVPAIDYPSPWPAYARGVAFRPSPDAEWQYIFPGPYLGQYFYPGTIPPDFQGGTALLFQRFEKKPDLVNLPKLKPENHKVEFRRNLVLRSDVNRLIIRDSTLFSGAFRSILAHAYIKGDSAQDMLGFTNYQLLHNALLSDSILVQAAESQKLQDTISMNLDLSKGLILKNAPTPDRAFALPMVYSAKWVWTFESKDSLIWIGSGLPEEHSPLYELQNSWQKISDSKYEFYLDLKMKKCFIKEEEIRLYQHLFDFLNSEHSINIGRLKR